MSIRLKGLLCLSTLLSVVLLLGGCELARDKWVTTFMTQSYPDKVAMSKSRAIKEIQLISAMAPRHAYSTKAGFASFVDDSELRWQVRVNDRSWTTPLIGAVLVHQFYHYETRSLNFPGISQIERVDIDHNFHLLITRVTLIDTNGHELHSFQWWNPNATDEEEVRVFLSALLALCDKVSAGPMNTVTEYRAPGGYRYHLSWPDG